MTHPNAFAAALTAGLAALITWGLRSRGVNINQPEAALLAGALSSAVLFVGRRGLKGAAKGIWNGTKSAVNGQQPKATK